MQNKLSKERISKVTSLGDNSKLQTLVVIPCYNEEKRLDQDAFIEFAEQNKEIGFVFVDDGSQDGTLSKLNSMRMKCAPQIEVITLSQNYGKAEAVRAGLVFATSLEAPIVAYWDADLATPLQAIVDFQSVIMRYDNLELVYGARRTLMGHRIYRTWTRRIVSRICATLARLAISMPVSDTQCGAKLLRNSESLKMAVSKPFAAGWLFDVELFARLSSLLPNPENSFYEYPLSEWEEVAGSKITGSAVVRAGFSVLGLIAKFRIFGEKVDETSVSCPAIDGTLVSTSEPVSLHLQRVPDHGALDIRKAA